ncbi:MAG: hypothetical protein U9N13_01170, partial [Euryarchaeota archaeon]|nr:hypothetical protein [Euryarchaeota archaeon]
MITSPKWYIPLEVFDEISVTVGTFVSTSNVTNPEPRLPSRSVAYTITVCDPSARPVNVVFGVNVVL